MPELPEVETIARQLRARGVEGKEILAVKVAWAPTIEPYSVAAFSKAVKGTTINEISRVGKWMMFSLSSGQTIMVHLRMAGSFSMGPGSHDRIVLKLSDGLTLYYRDTRKFGRWKLVDDPDVILKGLGPDALTRRFTRNYFADAMRKRHRMIKPLILDQSIVAGLGNIYADEALWEAKIHPERLSDSLTDEELAALFKAIKHVLNIGVANRGTSLGGGKTNYRQVDGDSGANRAEVKAYGRGGNPCDRCGEPLEKTVVAQRGTTFCPACQPI
ncbi:Formamidopyrimidine-DNA glycosylase [Pontiella desulfatans]|uniref:Formamidopyrimidine-DNA glycosylase n=1 Tax=Pontiella desulfatans TaxID=2750659 RepID=A0A6C2U868_PONDE|nr:bifunctional DNA-formamidopyrimidine glycosylase/DNA-(apurinic or apyrimidinic site) lyase [Pontiella desulfatans]VGO16145.1 Formamidopyrimidine-DNA glycosylase [Pontiella desulfatans]